MKLFRLTIFSISLSTCSLFSNAQDVKPISLSQLENRFKQGKDTSYVVNFWATWCMPCIRELPEFEKLKENSTGKPIKVILVSVDISSKLERSVKPFVKKQQLSGEIFIMSEAIATVKKQINPQWTGALPATWIINAEKRKFYTSTFTYEELVSAVQGI